MLLPLTFPDHVAFLHAAGRRLTIGVDIGDHDARRRPRQIQPARRVRRQRLDVHAELRAFAILTPRVGDVLLRRQLA